MESDTAFSGVPTTKETLVVLHNNLGWLKDFIHFHGDERDRPPHADTITEVEEYIERAAARLSTPPASAIADGSL